MKKKPQINLSDIRLLVLDVDGVLTNGDIIIAADGAESKQFNTHDGHGIRMWQRAGLKTALLSGRFSEPTKHRAEQLGIDYCFQDCHDKLPILTELLDNAGITASQVAYIGDDLPDLSVMRFVGFAVASANAVEEVKQCADFVTERPGGSGAVREAIEHILKKTGQWQKLMKRYLE